MARLVLPSRLELKRRDGSLSEAPLAKVSFTRLLYVSPVQMMPSCSHTGTPSLEFDGFLHFTSSTTSGSASLISARTRASVSPRQSPSAAILASISREGESPVPSAEALFVFFMVVVAFVMVVVARPPLEYSTQRFASRAIGSLASPRLRVELRRASRAHGCRGSACPCSWTRRA